MRISDWSSDVCSSDLSGPLSYVVPRFAFVGPLRRRFGTRKHWPASCGLGIAHIDERQYSRQRSGNRGQTKAATCPRKQFAANDVKVRLGEMTVDANRLLRSEEHTSELQSLMRI